MSKPISEYSDEDQLAVLAHRLWYHWTDRTMRRQEVPLDLFRQWEEKYVPYEDLEEEEKEKYRGLVKGVSEIQPRYD
jgi:hypothetical protein